GFVTPRAPAAPAAPASPPAARPAPSPPRDAASELQRLADEVTRLDPKTPDYPARVKAILEALIRVNQQLARDNTALKDQLAALAPPPRASRSSAPPAAKPDSRPAAAVPKPGAAAAPGTLSRSRRSTVYHLPDCQFGDRIAEAERVIFADPTAA